MRTLAVGATCSFWACLQTVLRAENTLTNSAFSGQQCFYQSETLAKSNQGFIYDWIWVKPLCKSIIAMKEALLRFTIVLFSGKLIFNGVRGHWYNSIKIAILKTLRGLDTAWNFARSITRVSTHEHEHWEHCLCRVYQKEGFWTTHVSSSE